MEIFLAALIFIGIAIFIMCFNIIFRKKPFPDSEIGHSKEMRKRGIICAKEYEIKLWGKKSGSASACGEGSCASCGFADCEIKLDKKEKAEA